MGKINKAFALTQILIIVVSCPILLIANPTSAQTIAKPSIPEFTIKIVDASYSTTTVNPYTGLEETKQTSNISIEIKITNQQFGYSNSQIYYNIRAKPSFGNDWVEAYPLQNRSSSPINSDGTFTMALYVNDNSPQSTPISTTLPFPIEQTSIYGQSGNFYNIQKRYHFEGDDQQYFSFVTDIPEGGKVDFQIEAILGHNSTYWYIQHPLYPEYGGLYQSAIAYDSTSGWSNTQTISIPDGKITVSSSPNPTQSPTTTSTTTSSTTSPDTNSDSTGSITLPLNIFVAIIAVTAVVVAIAVALLALTFRRRRVNS
jgi:hypothetical protein